MVEWTILPEHPTAALVIVSNISSQATEKIVKDFFLFCGNIKAFEMQNADDGQSKVALVLFERESAAKTAAVLSNALIVDSQITVKPYFTTEPGSSPAPSPTAASLPEESDRAAGQPLRQEEKPKASIVAELLASGYTISDQVVERAKEFDGKYHVTGRVQAAIVQAKAQARALDEKYKIQETIQTTAKSIDSKLEVTKKAQMVEATAKHLAEQALATETGKKVVGVVNHAQSKAQQISGEARAISEEKKREKASGAMTATASVSPTAVTHTAVSPTAAVEPQ